MNKLYCGINEVAIRATRFEGLGFAHIGRHWRFVALDGTPATVGPLYRSKDELLSDLPRYAREAWGLEA
jgi:hypothetical protein